MLRLQKLIYTTLAERSKKSVEDIRKACLDKARMDAKTALEFGLVDRILTRADMANMFRPEVIASIMGKIESK
jgi:ATP-dependent protease ClpP protease subunit